MTILEGKVAKITRKSDGAVLWKKGSSYTNLLPLATDTDRKTIYQGKGYITGYRLSSSSGGLSKADDMCASGFIPCKVGDVLRIKGTKPKYGITSYVMTFNSANTKVNAQGLPQDQQQPPDWSNVFKLPWCGYDAISNTLTIILSSDSFGTGWNAIRFSASTIDENTVVTINQEITD